MKVTYIDVGGVLAGLVVFAMCEIVSASMSAEIIS